MVYLRILAQGQSPPRPDRRHCGRRLQGQFEAVFDGCCFYVFAEVSSLYTSEEFAYFVVVVALEMVENSFKKPAAESYGDQMQLKKLIYAKALNRPPWGRRG